MRNWTGGPRPRDSGPLSSAARNAPGGSWLCRLPVDGLSDLLDLDLSTFAGPVPPASAQPCPQPLLLVCTNGKRDLCCSLRGRPLAADLAADLPGQVWEATHLGGHRFAPTAVVLPHGYVYGRLDPDTARSALYAAETGSVLARGCRGRSTWERPAQAAELLVREHIGEWAVDAVRPTTPAPGDTAGPDWLVTVEHVDGRRWRTAVRRHQEQPARPESCGRDDSHPTSVRAELLAD